MQFLIPRLLVGSNLGGIRENLGDPKERKNSIYKDCPSSKIRRKSSSFHILVPNMMTNWKKIGDFYGFWRAYLEEEAEKLVVAQKWDSFRN